MGYWLDPESRFGGRQWQKDKKARQLSISSKEAEVGKEELVWEK